MGKEARRVLNWTWSDGMTLTAPPGPSMLCPRQRILKLLRLSWVPSLIPSWDWDLVSLSLSALSLLGHCFSKPTSGVGKRGGGLFKIQILIQHPWVGTWDSRFPWTSLWVAKSYSASWICSQPSEGSHSWLRKRTRSYELCFLKKCKLKGEST